MQSILLNILVLGLLVLVFVVMYRKGVTFRLRFWIAGWLFTLFHFAVFLVEPRAGFWQNLQFAAGMGALVMTGVSFLLASLAYHITRKNLLILAAIISFPALALVFMGVFQIAPSWLLIALAVAGEAAVLIGGRYFRSAGQAVLWVNNLSALACGAWLIRTIATGSAEYNVYPILTQLFIMNAVLFRRDFRRVSAGVLTGIGGLIAWAAVFPAGLIVAHYFPALNVPSFLWDAPKYFVEFGMILTLFENQVRDANLQREQYRLLFDSNPHPMYIYDAKTFTFLRVNDAAVRLYGYSREEFLSKTMHDIRGIAATSDVDGVDLVMADAHRELKLTGPWIQRRKDGSEFQAEISSHPIEFENCEARVSMVRDITVRVRMHEKLLHQAHHDSLTNLPNRFLLEQRMRHTLENAARYTHKAAVLCIDLDRFKQINDTYGHAAGDACLQEVAKRLTSRLRESDTVARTGGEEFTVVIGELLYSADAEKVAADLLASFQRPVQVGDVELKLSASVGVALYPEHGTEGKELWRAADLIMYRAKFSGGNRYMMIPAPDDNDSKQMLSEAPSKAQRAKC